MKKKNNLSGSIDIDHLKVSRILHFFFFTLLMPAHSSPKSRSSKSRSSTSSSSIKCGVKHIKKPVNTQPLKRAKHAPAAPSNVSTRVEDNDSIMTDETEVIEVNSDIEEQDVLEEQLGTFTFLFFLVVSHLFHFLAAAQKTWRSPVYSFFKHNVTIQKHNGRVAHFFSCTAVKCRSEGGGVRRFQDKADKSSTANLRHHVIRCWGEDAVNTAVKGELGASRSGDIFSSFARQGQRPVTYSHRAHTTPEFR